MKSTLIFTLLSCIFLFPFQSQGQKKRFNPKQRFHAGVIMGMNLSQIDGDHYTGFDKTGVMAGLQGIALINRRVELVTELLYSQKGAKMQYLISAQQRKERVLGLNYAEVPFLTRITLTSDLEAKNPIQLETGFSFARLVNTKIEEKLNRVQYSFTEIAGDFVKSEINFIIGLQMKFSPSFNLGIRSNTGLTKAYINKNPQPLTSQDIRSARNRPYEFFRNYQLSFYASYQLY